MNLLKLSIFRRIKPAYFLFLVAGILIGTTWNLPYRSALRHFFQDDYGTHVYRCDSAMRNHFIAKSQVADVVDEQTVENLAEAEIALVDCHDYDVFRKRLISYGLTENDLSIMGLNAIEEKGGDIQKLVRIHEIRY